MPPGTTPTKTGNLEAKHTGHFKDNVKAYTVSN